MADEPDACDPPKRLKVNYLGVPIAFKLELACQQLFRAFGEVCYQVGSSLARADWRDVDVVIILSDEEFLAMFPDVGPIEHRRWEFDPKWLLMSVMISDWLTHQCGAPVDFKFQPRSWANEMHKGRRDARGLIFTKET